METTARAKIHRNLERRPTLWGLEMQDLVCTALLASVMNLIFGKTAIGAYATFLPPALLGAVLFLCKRGKPDGFLVHLVRYHASPGFYSAAETGRGEAARRRKIHG